MLKNFFLNQQEKSQKKIKLDSYPVYLQADTSNKCPSRCIMCPKNQRPFQSAEINDSIINKIKVLFPYVCQFKPDYLGECFTYSKFIELVNSFNKNTTFFITTSLLALEEKHINVLKKRKGIMNVSIDASSERMYNIIRAGDINYVKRNIARIKKETRFDLWLNMTVSRLNFHEVESFLALAEELNPTTVILRKLDPFLDFIIERNEVLFDYKKNHLNPCDINSLKNLTLKKKYPFRIIDFNNDNLLMPDFYHSRMLLRRISHGDFFSAAQSFMEIKNKSKMFCARPWERLLVDLEGNVKNCPCQKYVLGNLNNDSILDIWNGEKITSIREKIAQGSIPDDCSTCPMSSNGKLWL